MRPGVKRLCGGCGILSHAKSMFLPNGKRGLRCEACRAEIASLRTNPGMGMGKPQWRKGSA